MTSVIMARCVLAILVLLVVSVRCRRNNGEYCKKDHKCRSSHCCVTRCRECCLDSHCARGQVCRRNECEGPSPIGHSCDQGSDCRTGHCCGGTCEECCVSGHCSTGEKCRQSHCVGNLAPGSHCLHDYYCSTSHCCANGRCGECCKHSHCPGANTTCLARTCVGPRDVGVRCTAHTQCSSGSCCGPPRQRRCEDCCDDEDCARGENCYNNVCRGPRQNSALCEKHWHCASGHCCANTHNSSVSTCSECCADTHCHKERCNEWQLCGHSVPHLCSQHVPCSAGYYCSSAGLCQAKLRNKAVCGGDAQCMSGSCCGIASKGRRCEQCCKDQDCRRSQSCVRRRCVGHRSVGEQCARNYQCQSGRCCSVHPHSPLGFRYCSHCCSDKDCPGNQACLGRSCILQSEIGTPCTECKKGTPCRQCKTTQCCKVQGGKGRECQECCADRHCQVGWQCYKDKCVLE